MASLHCYFLLFPLLVIFLFIHPAMSDPNSQAEIDSICRQTEDYGFCNTTFSQNVDPPTTNITGLTQVTIKLALYNATRTYGFILDLLNTTTNQTVKDYLTVCQNAYYIVIDFFEQATNAFAAADYKSVLKYEQQTPRAAASCVTIFQTPPTPPNPLNERNRQMRILISMAVLSAFDLVNGS